MLANPANPILGRCVLTYWQLFVLATAVTIASRDSKLYKELALDWLDVPRANRYR